MKLKRQAEYATKILKNIVINNNLLATREKYGLYF